MKQCPNCGAQAQDDWTVCPSCFINMQQAASLLGRDYYVPPVETGQAVPNTTTPVVVETNLIMTDRDTIEEDGGQIISDTTDPARMIFFDLLHRHPGVQSDPKRFGALIGDYYRGAYRKEMTVLIDSLREGIPEILLKGSENTPYSIQASNLARRLVLNWGFNDDLAAWAVDTWALGLGLIKVSDLKRAMPSTLDLIMDKQTIANNTAPVMDDGQTFLDNMYFMMNEFFQNWCDLGKVENAGDYSKALAIATNMAFRAQVWHNKFADLQVPLNLMESKTAILLSISERKVSSDAYAKGFQHILNGKNSEGLSIINDGHLHQNLENQYMLLTWNNRPEGKERQKFIDNAQNAYDEITQILAAGGPAEEAGDFSKAIIIATNVASRVQFWHDKTEATHLSPAFQESKTALLLALSEYKAGVDPYVKMMQIIRDRGQSEATAGLIDELWQNMVLHWAKGNQYLILMNEKLPVWPDRNQKVLLPNFVPCCITRK